MKRYLIWFLVGLLLCTPFLVGAEGAQETSGDAEQVELRLGWWGGEARHEIYFELIEAFEERYPNISLSPEPASWGDYWDKLATQAAGGNAPDILHMHLTRLHEYASRNVLLNLDPYVEEGVLDLSDWTQGVVDSGKYNDHIYTISIGNSITATFVNVTGFERLGIALPPIDTNWSWDDFLGIMREAREIESDPEKWIMLDQSGGDTPLDFYLRQRGKSLFTEDGQLGFDEDDLTAWFEMWAQLRDEAIVPPAEVTAEYESVDHADRLLTRGRVLVNFTPGNQVPRFQRHMESDTIEMRRYPTYPEAQGEGEFVEGAYISVAERTEYPRQAVTFLDWFMNTEEAISIFKTEHGAFGNKKMNEFIMPQLDPTYQHVVEFTQIASAYASPRIQFPQGSAEVLGFYGDAAEDIRFGQKTIDEAVEDFFSDSRSVLQ